MLAALFLIGCAPHYQHPELGPRVAQHVRVAIAPLQWQNRRKASPRQLPPAQLDEQGQLIGQRLQTAIFRQLEHRAPHLQLQSPQNTNALLSQPPRAVGPTTRAQRLGVDAIVSGHVVLRDALPSGAALLLEVIGGLSGESVYAPTSNLEVTLSMHDGRTGTLLWQCKRTGQGELGEEPETIAHGMLQQCHLPKLYTLSSQDDDKRQGSPG